MKVASEPVTRFAQNPILRPVDLHPSVPGMKIESLLNPGAFTFDGKSWLLVRVAERPEQVPGKTSVPIMNARGELEILEFDDSDPRFKQSDPRVISYRGQDYLTTLSHLRLVVSEDGIHFHEPPSNSLLMGQGELESFGIEDCRVVQIDDTYYLTFTQVSPHGVGVGLRSTRDWRAFHSHGMILPPHNKDCAIFPERIRGRYYAFHRPSSVHLGGNFIWIAESPDLEHWGNHRCVAHTRTGMWDSERIGAGAQPIRTSRGWLEIYHGASADPVRYSLGALLLDLNQPWKVLARSVEPIMQPTAPYELSGFFGNVVFTNGQIVDGDQVTIYYGASDTVVCGARLSIEEILCSLGETTPLL
jgi:beta-1,2-mannobiose phosphorylase / 1,2-beta-oligomannan phosphorylase